LDTTSYMHLRRISQHLTNRKEGKKPAMEAVREMKPVIF